MAQLSLTSVDPEPLLTNESGIPEKRIPSEMPTVFGARPSSIRTEVFKPPVVHLESIHYVTLPNILYCIFCGSWLGLSFVILGILMCLTVVGFKTGLKLFSTAKYLFYPFGYYSYLEEAEPPNIVSQFFFYLFSIIIFIPLVIAGLLCWEFIYYIPMGFFMIKMGKLIFTSLHKLNYAQLVNNNPQNSHLPAAIMYTSGSFRYFSFSIYGMDPIYLNLYPFVLVSLYQGLIAPESSPLREPITGTFISIIATIPCMYVIGVCTEVLSGRCGLVLGSLMNAIFTGMVELILFYFSIKQNLGDVVRAGITGAFLMNLLVIPGLAMFAGGLKWKEIVLNKKVQSVSGTFMFLAIVAVFFPAVFYGIYQSKTITCNVCDGVNGTFQVPINSKFNCSDCRLTKPENLGDDEIYTNMARPLTYVVSAVMPLIYVVGLVFSLKTHKYIYDQFEKEQAGEDDNHQSMKTWVCIVVLMVACVLFSIVCEILTDTMPGAISKMGLTERFVGLIFYTIIPAIAEFMNAIRFALEGNIGLSLEIANQGASVVSLIQMPALVLMAGLMGKSTSKGSFNLMFEMIDVYAVIISVLLRNFMFMEKSINYFTGFAFLMIFLFIALVYYFDPW